MFENAVLPGGMAARSRWTFALSLSAQAAFAGAVVLCSLWYSDSLPALTRNSSLIFPPPPLQKVEIQSQTRSTATAATILQVARPFRQPTPSFGRIVAETPGNLDAPPMVEGPMIGSGSPAGAQYGTSDLVGIPPPPPPPPTQPKKSEPPKILHTTSSVLAGNLIHKVIPAYPALAKVARIQGVVMLQGVVSRDGTIKQLQVLSGPPMLAAAALEAVKQWIYRPTILNGEPVEVVAPIEVRFTLAQ